MTHTRRNAMFGAAWLVAAVAATAFGLAAVQLLGDGLGTADAQVGSTSAAPSGSLPTSASGPLTATAHLVTDGGEVYATCLGGPGSRAQVSAIPLAGWTVNTSNSGSTVEFRGPGRRLTVESGCTATGPVLGQARVSDDGSTSATPSAASSESTAGTSSTGATEPGDDKGGDRPSGVSDDSSAPTAAASVSADDHGGGSRSSGGSGKGGGSGSGSGGGSDDD